MQKVNYILLMLSIVSIMSVHAQTTYYLRADGNDTCTGLRLSCAIQTFSQASDLMSAGDYLFCDGNGGVYDTDTTDAIFTASGTSGSHIYITGFNDFKIVNSDEDTTAYLSLVSSDYIELNRILFNDKDDYDSLVVYLGYGKNYWIKNCDFYENAFLMDSLGTSQNWPNTYITHTMFCQSDSTYRSIVINNDLTDGGALNINYCSFYLTTPVYILNTDNGADGLYFNNSIVESAKYLWEVGSGTISTIQHRNYVYYNAGTSNSSPVVSVDSTAYNTDPMFNNTIYWNFYLKYDSPCIQYSTNGGTIGAKGAISIKAGGE